jgi:hypothetical protein
MRQDEMPKREDFERTLGRIYSARSKATHEGQPFPVTASYTGGPSISTRAASVLFGTDSPFPPVVWFERIVHSALSGFWKRSLPAPSPSTSAGVASVKASDVQNPGMPPANDPPKA